MKSTKCMKFPLTKRDKLELAERIIAITKARQSVDSCILEGATPDLGEALMAGGCKDWEVKSICNAVLVVASIEDMLVRIVNGESVSKKEAACFLKRINEGYDS